MTYDVSVVGLYILDVLGRPVVEIPANSDVAFIDEIRATVAGTAGGTAVDCAKLGLKTLAVGAVGDDALGRLVVDILKRQDVDVSGMLRVAQRPTSATILNIRPNGERPALHRRGASDCLVVTDGSLESILSAKVVHVGGAGLLAGLDGEPTARLLRAAKEQGCTTTFDLIAANERTLDLIAPSLPYIDYFLPSIEEVVRMTDIEGAKRNAEFFLGKGVGTCLITMGADGSFVMSNDDEFMMPAFRVPVTDTTGCGDAYSAGFIAAFCRGWDVRDAAKFATAAGALVATGLGSDAGIVDFKQTEDFMRGF